MRQPVQVPKAHGPELNKISFGGRRGVEVVPLQID